MAELPLIVAGPIVRRATAQQVNFWLVTTVPMVEQSSVTLMSPSLSRHDIDVTMNNCQTVQIGERAYIQLLTINQALPINEVIHYNVFFDSAGKQRSLVDLCPHIIYEGQTSPSFTVSDKISHLLHGSCRNPHHYSGDSTVRGDRMLATNVNEANERPDLLMLSGDQIYADDVAGPTLMAIHQVIELLGLYDETFIDALVDDGRQLYQHTDTYYRRVNLLPKLKTASRWFGRSNKTPIFSSRFCDNHLITVAEVLAMYFLVWSPTLWSLCRLDKSLLSPNFHQRFDKELEQINQFVSDLPASQRLMAHIPTYMIFDDHDVTDDWNLSALWEQTVYLNPLGRQVIGNTLVAYFLCQGWGNDPKQFDTDFVEQVQQTFSGPVLPHQRHDDLIKMMLDCDHWHYTVDTEPALIVLDTRTTRWRSERKLAKPSGLMDWEALCSLQQELIGKESVILVSAAPIFGLKLIEAIQHIVTALGFPLAVDAENWMAHSGAGNTLMQIFTHMKTPQNFIILSGDVHYSFVYDIKLHFKKSSPNIWQVTCSGIKNEFPKRLLAFFDWLNRWLYGPYSPLNWFTKRRAMKIRPRKPTSLSHRHSLSESGLGYLVLDDKGAPDTHISPHLKR